MGIISKYCANYFPVATKAIRQLDGSHQLTQVDAIENGKSGTFNMSKYHNLIEWQHLKTVYHVIYYEQSGQRKEEMALSKK